MTELDEQEHGPETFDGYANFAEWWAAQDELAAYELDRPTFSEMGVA